MLFRLFSLQCSVIWVFPENCQLITQLRFKAVYCLKYTSATSHMPQYKKCMCNVLSLENRSTWDGVNSWHRRWIQWCRTERWIPQTCRHVISWGFRAHLVFSEEKETPFKKNTYNSYVHCSSPSDKEIH